MTGTFNAATYFIDRHIDEGRTDSIAIECGDERISYRDLHESVNRFGSALREELGVRPEERVLLLTLDGPEMVYAFFGAIKIGAVPVPLNTAWTSVDYDYVLRDARPRVLIVGASLLPRLGVSPRATYPFYASPLRTAASASPSSSSPTVSGTRCISRSQSARRQSSGPSNCASDRSPTDDPPEAPLMAGAAGGVISSAAMRALAILFLMLVSATSVTRAQAPRPNAGRAAFERTCARCHGADGQGGEMGPGITTRIPLRTDEELATLVREGLPTKGMPAFRIADADLRQLVAFVRTLQPRRRDVPARVSINTSDGPPLSAFVLNRSADDMQALADDGTLHLFRKDGSRYRRVTSQSDWPTYHGAPHGNRYSPVDQINRATVGRLAPAWMFTVSDASRLQVTPIVVDGVMYVTGPNECYALDAGSGRRIWHFKRPRSKGLAGDAAVGINRGAAVAGGRLFMVTDDARLIGLNRFTGELVWETRMADPRQNYGATSAPLVVGTLVIVGPSGGDEGIRGFVAAFDTETGKEAWRFWTVPKPGEPGSETWTGTDIEHRCGAAWLTGTYDPDLDTLYWPTGNPCPDYDGSQRKGDNLYTDSILALEPSTGRLKWHFQYTPHDLWDWDAQQPPVLVDADWHGQPRQLLLHANRNGFFYVLDRVTGALLLAKPFVKKLTWAREIGADGRPALNAGQTPTAQGTKVCPAVEGATNWFSTSFSATTGLYYVQALEKCTIFSRSPETWRPGQSYYSGATRQVPDEPGQKLLRAIDVRTGEVRWEVPQVGRASTWGGTLATAGGLVFFGDDSGALSAVDASDGTAVWRFDANADWKASPMTYVFDQRQYIAVAAGPNIIAFALR